VTIAIPKTNPVMERAEKCRTHRHSWIRTPTLHNTTRATTPLHPSSQTLPNWYLPIKKKPHPPQFLRWKSIKHPPTAAAASASPTKHNHWSDSCSILRDGNVHPTQENHTPLVRVPNWIVLAQSISNPPSPGSLTRSPIPNRLAPIHPTGILPMRFTNNNNNNNNRPKHPFENPQNSTVCTYDRVCD